MNGVEDKHLDVLRNIEFAIVSESRAYAALHDLEVLNAEDARVRHYHAEETQRQPPAANLAACARRVFERGSLAPWPRWLPWRIARARAT